MDFMQLAASRYSVRRFDSRPIAPEHMAQILQAALLAPTGCNYQPQRIYVITDEARLAELNRQSKCIFGAKTVLLFTYDDTQDWQNKLEPGVHCGVQDVSIVATHVMLAAWELGVGSCWVNYFAPARLEQALGLPANERAVLLMPIGYPAPDAEPLASMHGVSRPLDEIVRFW